ncbi:MAG: serine/threonine-protein kinase [archaeon]|nr:serine/threonine-protein kinase [archaeon]
MGCCCKKTNKNKIEETTIPTLQDLDAELVPTEDTTALGRESNATYFSTTSAGSRDPIASLEDFDKLKVLGKGSFGKVVLVRLKTNGKLFAMKILKKDAIVKRKQIDHTKTERMMLEKLRHPFIVRLFYAFQDKDNLYFVTEFMQGGEMFFHLHRNPQYKDKAVIFYLSEILLAIEYMHKKNYIYRDLKPENVLIDFQGHIKLTDFGLSKILSEEDKKTYTMCGTAEYLAPEIILEKGYDKSCDWFSFGALMFEMLCGYHPFPRKGRKIDPRIYMSPIKIPRYLTEDARDLLSKLLEVNPRKRIGYNGAEEIRKHPYFKEVEFEKVFAKAYTPPFVPKLKGETDLKYFDPGFTSEDVDSFKDNTFKNKQNFDFEGFTYQPDDIAEEEKEYEEDSLRLEMKDKIIEEGEKENEL